MSISLRFKLSQSTKIEQYSRISKKWNPVNLSILTRISKLTRKLFKDPNRFSNNTSAQPSENWRPPHALGNQWLLITTRMISCAESSFRKASTLICPSRLILMITRQELTQTIALWLTRLNSASTTKIIKCQYTHKKWRNSSPKMTKRSMIRVLKSHCLIPIWHLIELWVYQFYYFVI